MQDYNICLCADDNYAKYMGVTMASILKNAADDENIIFHIIEPNISEDTKNKLLSLKKIKNCEIKFYRVENNKYDNLAICLRLLIPELINNTDKVLYLDSDIIINGSLKELFSTDIDDYYALVVKDLYVDIYKHVKRLCNFFFKTCKYKIKRTLNTLMLSIYTAFSSESLSILCSEKQLY